jgi:YrhK-like protein
VHSDSAVRRPDDQRDLDRWIGWLFIVGSTCFALGSAPFYAQTVDPSVVGITYFVGSLFFTSAGLLQFLQAVAEGKSGRSNRADILATAIQLAGTLFFNINTFAGMNDALSTSQKDLRVWAPDVFGSACFLISSELALREVCGSWFCVQRHDKTWKIAARNLLGSIFFGFSAVASFILPDTGELLNTALTNAFTFLGAICFLLGARLLLPQREGL